MGLFILPRTNAAAHRHPQRTCLAALALACLLTANAGTLAGSKMKISNCLGGKIK